MLKKFDNAAYLLRRRPLYFLAVVIDKLTLTTKLAKKMDTGTKDASEVLGLEVDSVPISSLVSYVESLSVDSSSDSKGVVDIHEFLQDSGLKKFASVDRAKFLADQLNRYKSDKSSTHGYEQIYQPIFDYVLSACSSLKISEIGLGTNNIEFLSNMGVWGEPGASCRAFRDFDQRIFVHGGDIDKEVLFEEGRISTGFVDQLSLSSLESFLSASQFDVLIDDGLHVARANFNFLATALRVVKRQPAAASRWIVIEDIVHNEENASFWIAVLSLLPCHLSSWLVKTNTRLMVVVLVPSAG